MPKNDPVKLPYSVAAIIKKRDSLATNPLFRQYIGKRLTSSDVLKFSELLRYKLNDKITLRQLSAAADMLKHRTLDERVFNLFIWRAAACQHSMLAGEVFLPWESLALDTWLPCEVINNSDTSLKLLVLATTLAGTEFDYQVSPARTLMLARVSGLLLRNSDETVTMPCQLFRMRLLLLARRGSHAGNMLIQKSGHYPVFTSYNRNLLKSRRVGVRKCPFNLMVPCHVCKKGRNVCELALKETTES